MKGKRHTTEDKIRILRAADGGKSIVEVCKEKNISEQTYHRWKRQFGMMEVNEARRLKELEKENTKLKKMLADSLLENRVLRFVNEKNCKPGAQKTDGAGRPDGRPVFRATGLSDPGLGSAAIVSSRWCQDSRHCAAHPRYGYRRIAALLRQEGWVAGKRQVQRLRRLEGLRVPPTKRKIAAGAVRPACRPRPRTGAMSGPGTSLRTRPCVAVLYAC